MSSDYSPKLITKEAQADYSGHQFRFMKMHTVANRAIVAASGSRADFVLYNDPDTAGKSSALALPGQVVKMEAGAAITRGDVLECDSVGRGITYAGTGVQLGTALETAAAAGDYIQILFLPNQLTS